MELFGAPTAGKVVTVIFACLLNPSAVSFKGAQGIAQFMPGTARQRGLEDSFDPGQAILNIK